MAAKRIVFTGGTGKAGRHAVPHLKAKGYEILNVDLKPLDLPGVNTLIADLTDTGQAFNALSQHFGFGGYDDGKPPSAPDAVVHFAAIPRVLIEPDNVTFAKNVLSTYNVIEAAMKLGVRKVIIASSETTYGVCFAEGDKDFKQFPLEEDYDVDPAGFLRPVEGLQREDRARVRDALWRRHLRAAHRQCDRAARIRAFRRITPPNPLSRKRNAWSYIDARDLGEIVHLCLEKDGLGFQVFNAINDTATLNEPTPAFLAQACPKTPVTRELGELEAPLSNRKAREVLGFKEAHDWRKYA